MFAVIMLSLILYNCHESSCKITYIHVMAFTDSILTQIGYRQLSLKDTDSNSWYIYCVKIAGKYGLPQIHDVFDGTVSPSRWRYLVKKTIQDHWEKALISDAATKSTLTHIHISALTVNHPHPVQTKRGTKHERYISRTDKVKTSDGYLHTSVQPGQNLTRTV